MATTTLLPKEHGAYGQLTLPLVTALSVAGLSTAGLLLTTSAVALFVAHEPIAVLLGSRGARARRERRVAAIRWLTCSVGIAVVAGTIAVLTIAGHVRWSIAVPIVPSVLLGVAMVRGREKSWYGELAAALAFAGLGVPVTMAAGASLDSALAVAAPFALLFATSTLAVRSMILGVRGGGNPEATLATRRTTFAVIAI